MNAQEQIAALEQARNLVLKVWCEDLYLDIGVRKLLRECEADITQAQLILQQNQTKEK